jgi:hypothetical protein
MTILCYKTCKNSFVQFICGSLFYCASGGRRFCVAGRHCARKLYGVSVYHPSFVIIQMVS